MIWFLENPARSKNERLALEQLAGSVDWLVPVGWRMEASRLSWDADILVGEQTYPVTLRYPNHFPFSPVLVLPRGEHPRWSSHQYGAGGELCLEYGPDNWHPDLTGAELISSAHRLLLGEMLSSFGGPEVSSRHKTTLGDHLSGKRRRFFVDQEVQTIIAGLREGETVAAVTHIEYHEHSSVRFLASAEVGDPPWTAFLPAPFLSLSFPKATVLIRLSEDAELPATDSVTAMRKALVDQGLDVGQAEIVVFVRGIIVTSYQLDVEADAVSNITIILEAERKNRLDPSHNLLKERKVAVVGCGSMGSKIAATLARSGVGHFVLVDGDIFLLENLVRNDLDWRDIGLHKVDGVANRILMVNPKATCDRYRRILGGQASSAAIEGLIEVLEGCDILVDATADKSAFDVLTAVMSLSKRPVVWGEVFAGGLGGFIARSRPGQEPNPAIVRRTIEVWCEEKGRTIAPAMGPYDGGDAEPAIASDADVSIIASHLSAFALDTLLGRTPSSYLHAVYLIGLRAEWIFDQALEVHPIQVGPSDEPEAMAVDPEVLKAELLEIVKRLTEHPNANSSES